VPKVKLIAASATVALFLVSCGNSGSEHKDTHGWLVVSVEPPRTLRAGREVGYCAGDPLPTIRHPRIVYEGNDVYVDLKIKWPHKPSKDHLCLGSELVITKTITLRRDLKDVNVYDSGVEPPELRWPSE